MDPDAVDRVERVPHGGATDPEVLDFSANVNPERPPGVEEVYREALAASRRYADDGYPAFRAAAGDYLGVDPDRVVPTPGGLAAIRLAVGTRVRSGDSVLVPSPSFGEYAREARLRGATPEFVAHDRVTAADPADHALAVVCNPNNPTGDAYDPDDLRSFARRCRRAGTVLLVDEAFLGFCGEPSMADVVGNSREADGNSPGVDGDSRGADGDSRGAGRSDGGSSADAEGDEGGEGGVVVARSLTKLFGLPGLRVGFAVADGRLRDRMATARRAWNVGTPAAAVGTHCLRQGEFVARTRERVERERARMRAALAARGFDVHPSSAPFLLLDAEGVAPVDDLLRETREAGIAVRDARTFRGLDSHLRVAVRRPGENDRLLAALGANREGDRR